MTEQQDRCVSAADAHDGSSRDLRSLNAKARSRSRQLAESVGASMKRRQVVGGGFDLHEGGEFFDHDVEV
jgi:hypothetical protein